MPDNFVAGENDAAGAGAPPIETMGARYGIGSVTLAQTGRGEPVAPEPYLMPVWHGRRGSMERVQPSITLTPLGGLMPAPGMPEPQIDGHVGAFPLNEDNGQFQSGIIDGWPEGVPVPVRSK